MVEVTIWKVPKNLSYLCELVRMPHTTYLDKFIETFIMNRCVLITFLLSRLVHKIYYFPFRIEETAYLKILVTNAKWTGRLFRLEICCPFRLKLVRNFDHAFGETFDSKWATILAKTCTQIWPYFEGLSMRIRH